MNKMFRKVGMVGGAVLASGAAVAAGPTYDVTTATAAITAGGTAIATLGVAALVLVIGLKVWKRLRGAA
jgi:Inovirus Coat protein B